MGGGRKLNIEERPGIGRCGRLPYSAPATSRREILAEEPCCAAESPKDAERFTGDTSQPTGTANGQEFSTTDIDMGNSTFGSTTW